MKFVLPFRPPGTVAPTPVLVGACYDCDRCTAGRCWRHTSTTHVYTPIVVSPAIGAPPPIMGDLIAETGLLPLDWRWP